MVIERVRGPYNISICKKWLPQLNNRRKSQHFSYVLQMNNGNGYITKREVCNEVKNLAHKLRNILLPRVQDGIVDATYSVHFTPPRGSTGNFEAINQREYDELMEHMHYAEYCWRLGKDDVYHPEISRK